MQAAAMCSMQSLTRNVICCMRGGSNVGWLQPVQWKGRVKWAQRTLGSSEVITANMGL